MSRRTIAAFLTVVPAMLALAACESAGAPDSPAASHPDRDACAASAYADRVGQNHARFDFSAPDRPLRILGPDSPMTMDYRVDRLNVDIDRAGIITRIWCG